MKQNANITGIGEQLSINDAIVNPPLATVPHTTIKDSSGNPRKIHDLSKTLKPIIGKERITVPQIYPILDEYGPNGEPVWGVHGEHTGRIRLVGDWDNFLDIHGPRVENLTGINSFAEITFWGTGLNILTLTDAAGRDARVSVDGGSTGSNIIPSSSAVLLNQRWSENIIINAASNLSLGWHTVRIDTIAAGVNFFGIEILGPVNQIAIPAGEILSGGKKYTNPTTQLISYNTGFYGNPSLNGRGGRVLVYIEDNGQIKKAIQQVDDTTKSLNLADHSNEEEERYWHYTEFGAGRNDDFSTIRTSTAIRHYTTSDNVTSLSCTDARLIGATTEFGVNPASPGTSVIIFKFVGSGVDVVLQSEGNGGLNSFDVAIDDVSVGSLSFTANNKQKRFRLVSGLPYGFHTVTLTNTASPTYNTGIHGFFTFKPKAPSIPQNAIIIGDTCLSADFDGSTATSTTLWHQAPQGTVGLSPIREVVYMGTWILNGPIPGFGWSVFSSTNGDSAIIRFWGKAITLLFNTSSVGSTDFTATIDGSLVSSGIARGNMTNLGSGSYRVTQVVSSPSRVEFSGLTEDYHEITLTKTGGGGALELAKMFVASATYAHKTNSISFHDGLAVGSCGINAIAKLPVELRSKSSAFSTGIAQNPTNNQNFFFEISEMRCGINVRSRFLRIKYTAKMLHDLGTGAGVYQMEIRVNGFRIPFTYLSQDTPNGSSTIVHLSDEIRIPVSPGVQSVQVVYASSNGTTTAFSSQRHLQINEED